MLLRVDVETAHLPFSASAFLSPPGCNQQFMHVLTILTVSLLALQPLHEVNEFEQSQWCLGRLGTTSLQRPPHSLAFAPFLFG